MKNTAFFIIFACCLLILSSCARNTIPEVQKIPEPLEEIHDNNLKKRSQGSLWSANNDSMFADHKARNVGDIVTVTIAEKASATKAAKTTAGRSSNWAAGIPNLFGLEKADVILKQNDHAELSNLISANFSNTFDGNGTTVRTDNLTASLTTQVIGTYSNGNLKIRGGKEVTVNNEIQVIYITGIIRPVDITSLNTVDSSKILNARITYTGKGILSDKQRAGWLGRAVDYVWPF